MTDEMRSENFTDGIKVTCPGRWFVVQTFEDDETELSQDIHEIRELLAESSENAMHKAPPTLYPIEMSSNTDQSVQVHKELVSFVLDGAPSAKLVRHPASKTSEESMEARHQASGERVTGAKALLVKMDVRDKSDVYAVMVLPGFSKLDSKATKKELKERVPGFRSFRFATPEEMEQKARGMQPGKMPPFGRPIFPDIVFTFIDEALLTHKRIGFNASDFENSIIMDMNDYVKIVTSDGTFPCSVE